MVSGWYTSASVASANQVLNWVRGEGERSERSRAPLLYWTAFVGSEEPPVGAKMSFEGAVDVDGS